MGQGTVPCPGQNGCGELVATYSYDDWGQLLSIKDENGDGSNTVYIFTEPISFTYKP